MTLLRYLHCLWQGHDWGNVWTIARGKPDYDVWSLKHCDSRAPTADEWGSFLRYATGTMEAA